MTDGTKGSKADRRAESMAESPTKNAAGTKRKAEAVERQLRHVIEGEVRWDEPSRQRYSTAGGTTGRTTASPEPRAARGLG